MVNKSRVGEKEIGVKKKQKPAIAGFEDGGREPQAKGCRPSRS